MELSFRLLRADEIDARVGRVTTKGISLLLYKDARCDMAILDETVGPLNWQRSHSRDNANCVISIYNDATGQWVSKEDTGTESNTEKEKGLASDSFKRAAVNWGIGRELYTAPFIWISAADAHLKDNGKGKSEPEERFKVTEIEYDDKRNISFVKIVGERYGSINEFGKRQIKANERAVKRETNISTPNANEAPNKADMSIQTDVKVNAINALAIRKGFNEVSICAFYKKQKFASLTDKEYEDAANKLNVYPDKEA